MYMIRTLFPCLKSGGEVMRAMVSPMAMSTPAAAASQGRIALARPMKRVGLA
mgnify:CR=1 FL=1